MCAEFMPSTMTSFVQEAEQSEQLQPEDFEASEQTRIRASIKQVDAAELLRSWN